MNDAIGPGHNQPPESPIDRANALVASANQWLAAIATIGDAETAGRAQDFVAKLRANKVDLEAEWKAEREPHDKAIVALRARYRTPLELIGIALTRAGERLAPWLSAEGDRLKAEAEQRRVDAARAAEFAERARQDAEASGTIEAELAARHADEAAKRATKAADKPVARGRVKSDLAAKAMTLRAYWHAEVVDADRALAFYANDASVLLAALEAATRLASALARETKDATKAPPGFRFVKTESPV